jgi:VCBS repeat-containing protein
MKNKYILKNILIIFILINTFFISALNINSTLAYEDYSPEVADIPDQFITKGGVFNLIYLDNFVFDINDSDDEIIWTYYGNIDLNISIIDRVATITTPSGWIGEETITFRATNTAGLFDEDFAIYNVSLINNSPNDGDPKPISGPGAIWTTRNDCGDQQQNVNEYCFGETVYINGNNFDPNKELNWSIIGSPNSCDPDAIIASGTHPSGDNGSFCFLAYTIKNDDCGGYQVNVENKNDNYNVIICNYPPVANDDYATVNEGGIVTILDSGNDSVLDNDTDPDGDSLEASLISGPSYSSSFILNTDGTFSYTHDGSETSNDSFIYNASDPYGAYDHATVTIKINPQNDPPVAVGDVASTAEDESVWIEVLGNDYDVDGTLVPSSGTLVPSSVVVTVGPSDGSVFVNASTGDILYTPDDDFFGSDSFYYTVDDDDGATSGEALVSVSVGDVNDPPGVGFCFGW